MDRQLIDYLPSYMQEYKEIKAIMDAEQFGVESTWSDTEDVFNNQFVQDATEKGIARYEKIFGITPKSIYTLEERKFNVLARMNEQLPYSMKQLHSALASLCGEDGYTLQLDADAYKLTVKLALGNDNNVEAVEQLLYKMLPANIVSVVAMFNTYLIVSAFTHDYLSTYTYKEVREAIL